MDYLSSHINNHGCALCVEKGLQIEIPPRAKVIRVLMDELTRLASHQLWWGALGMDIGAFTPFFHAFREREAINDIMEETCGARLTMNYIVPGGVMFDLHPNFQNRVKEFIRFFKTKIDEYDDLVTGISFSKVGCRGLADFQKKMQSPLVAQVLLQEEVA
jgi:NADH-quinone oxidoreductase subunit D/NADH-quinone oxidoreductase subunit C/D